MGTVASRYISYLNNFEGQALKIVFPFDPQQRHPLLFDEHIEEFIQDKMDCLIELESFKPIRYSVSSNGQQISITAKQLKNFLDYIISVRATIYLF